LSASGASVDQVDFLVRQAFRLAGHLVRPVERQHVRQQEIDNRRSDCRGGPTRALNFKQVAHFNKVCFDLFIDPSGRGQNRDPPKITTPKRKKILFWCKGNSKAREEMVREPEPEHSALRILQQISDLLPKEEQAGVSDTNFVHAQMNIYASPEEGERLIRAFIRIQQPAMRAAIIRLARQMALIKD
jgi:hypothetical protein